MIDIHFTQLNMDSIKGNLNESMSFNAIFLVEGLGQSAEPSVDLRGPKQVTGHEHAQHNDSLGQTAGVSS